MSYNGENYKTGDKITCTIWRTKITNAKIYIYSKKECERDELLDDTEGESYDAGCRYVLICNNKKQNDWINYEYTDKMKLGYRNVWGTVINGPNEISNHVKNLQHYKIPYVSPYYRPVPKKDNIALLIQNIICEENKKFAAAIEV
jgi:hypothetical protein